MGKLNKQQKIIIGVGILAILITIIVGAIVACSSVDDNGKSQDKEVSSKTEVTDNKSNNNENSDKESSDKNDSDKDTSSKNDSENEKNSETSETDAETDEDTETQTDENGEIIAETEDQTTGNASENSTSGNSDSVNNNSGSSSGNNEGSGQSNVADNNGNGSNTGSGNSTGSSNGGSTGGNSNGSSNESTGGSNTGSSSSGNTGSNSSGNTGGTSGGNSSGSSSGSSNSGSDSSDDEEVYSSGTLTTISNRVSVHDPSIEYDSVTKKWYIFGSHTAFASTSNLINWSYFEYEGTSNTKYGQIFAKSGEWAAKGSSGYDITGNLWAPDVIYNKDMGKWCMYMSVNGSNFYSSIAMATADSVTGPYTYQGTVVYSGFMNSSEMAETDYQKATGSTDISRYTSGGWGYYGTNAIDPCVLYDEDGQLWMVYGSWFGGTFMLKLDNKTGLRDYTYKYTYDYTATDGTAADPYLGIRISGGYGGTGEGPYIVWDEEAGYYYLYLSYCGLNATDGFSGYQMRLFRSKNIEGPYTDAAGNYANRKTSTDDQSDNGIKIMGNYYFSSLEGVKSSDGSYNGYKSPGHNSAIIDNAGNRYVIYHTRFDIGSEWHQVRVHQQFLNEDGWLVTAPYEYLGSKISEAGYSKSEIIGTYEYINHGNETTYNVVAGMLDTLEVKLNADGTITGDVSGTWSQKSGTPYATMVIGGKTYKGVFFKQFDESSSHTDTMTFTLIGSNNLAIWGSKIMEEPAETGKLVGTYTFDNASSLGADSTGSVGAATISGCTTYSDSTRGKVLSFDGTNDYVKLPAAATKNMKGYTIMMWIKPTTISDWARVFDLGDGTDDNMFFTLKAYESGMRFAHRVDGDDEKQIVSANAITANKWTHVAVTISASSKKAILYVNGTRVGSIAIDAHLSSFSGTQNYLGRSQYSSDPYFKGYMDDVYIFNYALSESEVTTYMNK